MRTYILDPDLSTEDAMLAAAAKNARDAGKIAADVLGDYLAGKATRPEIQAAQESRDAAERSELMLAGLAGYVEGYPAHVIAAIEAD